MNNLNLHANGGGNSLGGLSGNVGGSYTHPVGGGTSVIIGGNRSGGIFHNNGSTNSGSVGINHTENGVSTTITGTVSGSGPGHWTGIEIHRTF